MTVKTETKDLVEVYEVERGKGRAYYTHKPGAIEFLPTDAPLPNVGDVLLLPKVITGDEDAYLMLGNLTPYRVVEREFLYYRSPIEKHDPVDTTPAQYSKTWLHVRRISEEEYGRDPGSEKGSGN